MPTITLREVRATDAGFDAELRFDNQSRYEFSLTDPFAATPNDEAELEWYFERWLQFPFLNLVRKQQAEVRLRDYGQQLFEQVFQTHPEAYSEYLQLRTHLQDVQVVVEGRSPAFQSWHWEALWDPKWPRPLAVEALFVRQVLQAQPVLTRVQPSPVLNVLVVTARPDAEQDVGYRTISRPLVEVIQTAQLRVNIELLRPGTFEALARHLAQPEKKGFYHLIHFDVHGALATYAQLQAGIQQDRYTYLLNDAQSPPQPYEGVKAHLFFEGATPGQANPVEATDLAQLLTGAGIPICILNACQSGKQVRSVSAEPAAGETVLSLLDQADQRETSLGSRLLSAGLQMVVAMGYSVTVTAAKLLMAQVYRELFHQQSMTAAVRLGRYELFQNKHRKLYYDRTAALEDWLLPVVYCNQTVDLNLRPFTFEEEQAYYAQQAQRPRYQPPEYGFVGRDLDILKLEQALFKHNVVLLQGMGGTGKTTLLTYLQEWWQTTKFAQPVFYFGYDTRAWPLEQILFELGRQVYGRAEQALLQAMQPAAQVGKLVTTLNAQASLLLLDNLESVTGQTLAMQHTLPESEQTKLRDFLQQLAGGKTRVVLGSRGAEPWLQPVYRDNVYVLRGLDPEAQTDLATRVLERQVKDPERVQALLQDPDFKRLLQVLAGYPLALTVVLANLQHQSPLEILEALQAAAVQLDTDSPAKTQSILQCVEYVHRRLAPESQRLLLCLAPFSGFLDRRNLPQYVAQLQPLEPWQDVTLEPLQAALQEAVNWGLLAPDDRERPDLLTLQPVFPFFLKTRLAQAPEATRTALETAFCQHYRALAERYKQWLSDQDPQVRQQGRFFCAQEYENLVTALQLCLKRQEHFSVLFCLTDYLQQSQRYPQQLALVGLVCDHLETYPPDFLTSEWGYQVPLAWHRRGNGYQETQQYALAAAYYQKALDAYQSLVLDEHQKQLWRARAYHQLGMVAQMQRQYDQAKDYYQQALAVQSEFNDRYNQARTYHQLGSVAQRQRQYDQAKDYWQQALALFIEFNDRYSQAGTYFCLGVFANDRQQLAEAQANLQQALERFVEFKDDYWATRTREELEQLSDA